MWNRLIVTDQNRGVYGALVQEQLRQRRILFYEKLGWDIPRSEHIEQDQYDRAETVYAIVERDGQVEGYARLLPTTHVVSYGQAEFSYLTRDATLGLLPGVPPHILGGRVAPQDSAVWEVSRVEARSKGALKALFLTIAEYLQQVEARELITFTRKNFDAIVRGIGFDAEVIGEPVQYGGKPYCAISMRWGCDAEETPVPQEAPKDVSAVAESAAPPMRLAG